MCVETRRFWVRVRVKEPLGQMRETTEEDTGDGTERPKDHDPVCKLPIHYT